MSDAGDADFDQGDNVGSHYIPTSAGEIKKGGHLMFKCSGSKPETGKPCKVGDISVAKPGKHGSSKCSFTGIDIFTGKTVMDQMPSHAQCFAPVVEREEFTVMDIADDGAVSLLTASGETKDDLNLPSATDDDHKLSEQIRNMFEEGKGVAVFVLMACGKEKIVDVKELV